MRYYNLKNLTIIFSFLLSGSAYAQGAWDIAYAPISEVDESWSGREIRIDIKSEKGEVDPSNLRELLSTNDELKVEAGEEVITFIEDWKIYVDHGVLKDQLLQTDSEWIVREQIIRRVTSDKILIKVYAYKMEEGKLVKGAEEVFDINKSDLSGVFYSRG